LAEKTKRVHTLCFFAQKAVCRWPKSKVRTHTLFFPTQGSNVEKNPQLAALRARPVPSMAAINWEQAIRQATQLGLAASTRRAEWFTAMRWRRRIEAVFSEVGLTFTQWLILEAARELIAERGDAVNQNEIAARVELDRSTVCQVMFRLQDKSLVSRDIDITGREMRIWLTSEAMQILDDYRERIDAVSTSRISAGLNDDNGP